MSPAASANQPTTEREAILASEDLIRLSYCSTSQWRGQGGGTAADTEAPRILRVCRTNNPKLRIGGVLHYGNGYFFQVLEGPAAAVDHLYQTIGQDIRHADVTTLERKPVSSRRFPDWSMKYVPFEDEVNRVLARHKLKEFTPYRFGSEVIEAMVTTLVGAPAPEQQPDQDYSRPQKRGFWLKRLLGRS